MVADSEPEKEGERPLRLSGSSANPLAVGIRNKKLLPPPPSPSLLPCPRTQPALHYLKFFEQIYTFASLIGHFVALVSQQKLLHRIAFEGKVLESQSFWKEHTRNLFPDLLVVAVVTVVISGVKW